LGAVFFAFGVNGYFKYNSVFMNYDREILAVLTQAGEQGLKLEHIVRHVYNACNSMFTPLNYKDVYTYVSQYLVKSSKLQGSCVQKAGYGVYRLNLATTEAQQLMLQFGSHPVPEEVSEKSSVDSSLSLFGDDDF
jgi:hypothetical protein